MEKKNTSLLIIDVQEKLIPVIENKDEIKSNISKLIKAFSILDIEINWTEQNPLKLGKTIEELSLQEKTESYEKMDFSGFSCLSLIKKFERNNTSNVIICGIEAHVCIQQTAIDFLSNHYNVLVVVDAIGSRNPLDKEISLKRLENEGIKFCSTESIIFEICKTAKRSEFKSISNIIKGIK